MRAIDVPEELLNGLGLVVSEKLIGVNKSFASSCSFSDTLLVDVFSTLEVGVPS